MITIQEWTWIADLAGASVMPLSLVTLFVAFLLIPDRVEF